MARPPSQRPPSLRPEPRRRISSASSTATHSRRGAVMAVVWLYRPAPYWYGLPEDVPTSSLRSQRVPRFSFLVAEVLTLRGRWPTSSAMEGTAPASSRRPGFSTFERVDQCRRKNVLVKSTIAASIGWRAARGKIFAPSAPRQASAERCITFRVNLWSSLQHEEILQGQGMEFVAVPQRPHRDGRQSECQWSRRGDPCGRRPTGVNRDWT
jgi:hypothetical protein